MAQVTTYDDLKETPKDSKNIDMDTASCVCGKKFVIMNASECYDEEGVECDRCEKAIPDTSNVYHCPDKKRNSLKHQMKLKLILFYLKFGLLLIN